MVFNPFSFVTKKFTKLKLQADLAFTSKSECSLTEKEMVMAKLSQQAYNNTDERISFPNIFYKRDLSGLNFAVYFDSRLRVYYFVIRGTKDVNDLIQDLALSTGIKPVFFNEMQVEFLKVKKIADAFGYQMVVSGHSLGGTAANYISMEHNTAGVIFNAFYPNTSDFYVKLAKVSRVRKIMVKGDILSNNLFLIDEKVNTCLLRIANELNPLTLHSIDTIVNQFTN